MKTFLKIAVLLAVLLVLAGLTVSCDRDRDNDEPRPSEPEFYFEAYINGQRSVSMRQTTSEGEELHALWAMFWRGGEGYSDFLVLHTWTYQNQYISLAASLYHFGEGKADSVLVELHNSTYRILDCENSWLIITKFDTVNLIVSGTFQFVGKHPLFYGNEEQCLFGYLRITNGRFNTRFYDVNNTGFRNTVRSHLNKFQNIKATNIYTLK